MNDYRPDVAWHTSLGQSFQPQYYWHFALNNPVLVCCHTKNTAWKQRRSTARCRAKNPLLPKNCKREIHTQFREDVMELMLEVGAGKNPTHLIDGGFRIKDQ